MKETHGNISLRQAIDTDVEAISECINKAYGHYQERLDRPPGPMTQNYAEVIESNDVYVAMVDHRVEGVLVLTEASEGFLLDNIAVNPAAQGSGVGRVLLKFAEQQAWSAGYQSIYLYTHHKMWENRALYQRVGYEEFDRRTEQGLERVYMRKCLKDQGEGNQMLNVELPVPDAQGANSLVECTRYRRSMREYAGAPISLPDLSRLLWSAQGTTGSDGKRTTPSAGGLYCLHIRVLARHVDGMRAAIYKYHCHEHSLQTAGSLPSAMAVKTLGLGDQPWLSEAALVIAIAADFESALKHFESQPPAGKRGERYIHMETGALAQNIHLHATDLGLGCVLVAGFDDQNVHEVLGLPDALEPVALICIGQPMK